MKIKKEIRPTIIIYFFLIFLFISANNPMRPMAIHIAPIVLAVKYKKIPITNHKMNNRQPKFSLDIFITSSSACST